MKKISCREHKGGVFTVVAKRGRPPVRCTEENPCTVARGTANPVPADIPNFRDMSTPQLKAYAREHFSTIAKLNSRTQLIKAMEAQLTKRKLAKATGLREEQIVIAKTATDLEAKLVAAARADRTVPLTDPTGATETKKTAEPKFRASQEVKDSHGRAKSLELAQKAKAQLIEQGWDVQGSAKGELVTISALRGDELLSIVWKNGVAIDQNYSLWSVDKPSANGVVPPHSLPFDPDWATDSEIAAHLVGNKVTWWNRISGKEEHGIAGHDTISIEHRFDGAGHEIPSERLLKFIDGAGGNFRLVQLGQLLKVGK